MDRRRATSSAVRSFPIPVCRSLLAGGPWELRDATTESHPAPACTASLPVVGQQLQLSPLGPSRPHRCSRPWRRHTRARRSKDPQEQRSDVGDLPIGPAPRDQRDRPAGRPPSRSTAVPAAPRPVPCPSAIPTDSATAGSTEGPLPRGRRSGMTMSRPTPAPPRPSRTSPCPRPAPSRCSQESEPPRARDLFSDARKRRPARHRRAGRELRTSHGMCSMDRHRLAGPTTERNRHDGTRPGS
jgi:hypothetical protein